MSPVRAAFIGVSFVCSLVAQGAIAPPQLAEQWGNSCNLLPWNATMMRWHQLYEPAALGFAMPRVILSLGWRRCITGTYPAVTLDHEVSLFDVPLLQGTMSTTFATNRASGTGGVRLTRKFINLPAQPFGSPLSGFVMLPLDTPHVTSGPSLLVEAVNYGGTGSGWSVDMCLGGSAGLAQSFGTKCGPTANTIGSSGSYMPGQTLTILETSGPLNAPAFSVLGFSAATMNGLPLPLDLAPLNMPGCLLYTSLDLAQGTVLSGAGSGSVLVTIPNNGALAGLSFSAQWANVDPAANPFGFSMSDARRFTLGPIQCPMAYLYRLSDNLDTTGSYFSNRGQVLRLFP